MRDFIISTDSNSDLPFDYIKENNIVVIPHYYDIEGVTYGDEINLTPKEFYDKMRGGVMPTTMASNPAVIRETFEKYVTEGYDILHISFAAALSGGCSNVMAGARDICEEHTEAKITVLDSCNVSLGEGMVIMKAVELKKQGKSLDEIAAWIEENKLHFCVQFTVEDLFHLQRGGRLSKTSAIIGTMINIKPILIVDDEGKLTSASTVRGRKKSLNTIIAKMIDGMGQYRDQDEPICVVHGDSPEDADYVVRQIKEKLGDRDIIVAPISPSIGSHSGPGAIGIVYMGEKRE